MANMCYKYRDHSAAPCTDDGIRCACKDTDHITPLIDTTHTHPLDWTLMASIGLLSFAQCSSLRLILRDDNLSKQC